MQFYRFIQVETGIRESKGKDEEKEGKRAQFWGRKEKKERGEKRLRGRRKIPELTKQQLRWGGSAPKAAGFYTWTPYRRRFGAKKNREKVGND